LGKAIKPNRLGVGANVCSWRDPTGDPVAWIGTRMAGIVALLRRQGVYIEIFLNLRGTKV
jgi:hypothetical protein